MEKRRAYSINKRKAPVVQQVGHNKKSEFLATQEARKITTRAHAAFTTNERARLIHCFVHEDFGACVDILLKGTTLRVDMDDTIGRMRPWSKLARTFNDNNMNFENHFSGHPNGDEDFCSLEPIQFSTRRDAFLKGIASSPL